GPPSTGNPAGSGGSAGRCRAPWPDAGSASDGGPDGPRQDVSGAGGVCRRSLAAGGRPLRSSRRSEVSDRRLPGAEDPADRVSRGNGEGGGRSRGSRSEEHTSELQSRG